MTKILLINDEPDLLEVSGLALELAGYDVYKLMNGTIAMDSIRRLHPDLIGLDWVVPEVSGEELLAQLKAEPDTRDIPVLVISALEGIDDDARNLGAAGILRKPYRPDDLLTAVSRALAAARPAEESSSPR